MPEAYKIPLAADVTDQILTVELGGSPYKLRVLWNERFAYHSLSISTVADDTILDNIKMVRDYPLIGRFQDTRLPFGELIWLREKGKNESSQYNSPGNDYNLYYFQTDNVVSVESVTVVENPPLGSEWDSGDSEWDSGQSTWDM